MSVDICIKYNKNYIYNSLIPWNIKNDIIEDNIMKINGVLIELNNKKKVIAIPWSIELLYSNIFLLYNDNQIELSILKYNKYLYVVVLDIDISHYDKILDIKPIHINILNMNIDNNNNNNNNTSYSIYSNNIHYDVKYNDIIIDNFNMINIPKILMISCEKNEFISNNVSFGSNLYKKYNNNYYFLGLYFNIFNNQYMFIPNIAILNVLNSNKNNNSFFFNHNYHILNNMIIMNNNLFSNIIIKSINNNIISITDKNDNDNVMIKYKNILMPLTTYFLYHKKNKIDIQYYENTDDYNNNINIKFNKLEELILIEFNPYILELLPKYRKYLINDIINEYIEEPLKKQKKYLFVVKIIDDNIVNELNKNDINIDINRVDLEYIDIPYLYKLNNNDILFNDLINIKNINNCIIKYSDYEYILKK